VSARMELLRKLVLRPASGGPKGRKMVLLVMDGIGGLPDRSGRTELEAAQKPNLDKLASRSDLGMLEIVDVGITPGSGPGHLSLFGYDPLEYGIGRGILEALGVGAVLGPGDVCARGNFCTRDLAGIIVDRRAGRIPTEESGRIVDRLSAAITEIDGVRVSFRAGLEHRFVVIFSGEGLSERVTDADPQKEGLPVKWAEASAPGGERTAEIANSFIRRVSEVLRSESKANACLLRGFSSAPDIPTLGELYGISPVAIATYPMYKGLSRLVGMDIADAGKTLDELFDTVGAVWDDHDFFYIHVKYTDSRGEDGNFEAKRRVVEQVDSLLPKVTALNPDVLAITGDHSTPSVMAGHSWHSVPVLLSSPYTRFGMSSTFGERSCVLGSLGKIPGPSLMGLMLAHAGRLAKYGA
jgi:2,3-bisphosphoglycerate-independent phosphoglycerate mutase